MFEREQHRRIASVLDALNPRLLAANQCLFGGGTAIALRFGEFRESGDLDFLVSDVPGFRALRQLLSGPKGIGAITRPGATLKQAREMRADQYGIRTILEVERSPIKFEMILEARLQLERSAVTDRVSGIATLTLLDLAASTLLANSDRWADDAVFSRDVIDLAMMRPPGLLLRRALSKAQLAYGRNIETDLAKAIEQLRRRRGRLNRCMEALQMRLPRALLWQRIRALETVTARQS